MLSSDPLAKRLTRIFSGRGRSLAGASPPRRRGRQTALVLVPSAAGEETAGVFALAEAALLCARLAALGLPGPSLVLVVVALGALVVVTVAAWFALVALLEMRFGSAKPVSALDPLAVASMTAVAVVVVFAGLAAVAG